VLGNVVGGSSPPFRTTAPLVHVRSRLPVPAQLQPDPELGKRAPLVPLAENTMWVLPALAEVPVLRIAKVQVPLGAELAPESCCATNDDPPSLNDMIRSTAEVAAMPMLLRQAHAS